MNTREPRRITDARIAGKHFTATQIPTPAKKHAPQYRIEHRIDGALVSAEAWLDASHAAIRQELETGRT